MSIRRFISSVPIMIALIVSVFVVAPATQASPRQAPPAPAAVSIASKVILNETSVNAPGFYVNANLGGGPVIAWVGTDSLHHLNIMTGADALHYGHKITLNEFSVNRPAVTQMSKEAGGAVILAWRGTDSAHRLNMLFNVYGSQKKLILNETSFTTPGIVVFKGDLLLAWAGTDSHHSLNVLPISLSSLTPGVKTILSQFSANSGPNLTAVNVGSSASVVLSWATMTQRLNLASSTDGVHFTSALGNGLSETSPSSPNMLYFPSEGGPEYWLAWTGTGARNHLIIKWTNQYPQWIGTKTILPELALGGPGLGFSDGVVIAWTGTDSLHHLNVARLQGF